MEIRNEVRKPNSGAVRKGGSEGIIFFALAFLAFAFIYQAAIEASRLKNEGVGALGRVQKYELKKKNILGKIFIRHMHVVSFDQYSREFELKQKLEVGSKVAVLYLPGNPKVAIAGVERSFFNILIREYRWIGLGVACIACMAFCLGTFKVVINYIS